MSDKKKSYPVTWLASLPVKDEKCRTRKTVWKKGTGKTSVKDGFPPATAWACMSCLRVYSLRQARRQAGMTPVK